MRSQVRSLNSTKNYFIKIELIANCERGEYMNKKWLAALHSDPLYKARQLQAIGYVSLFLNGVLLFIVFLLMIGG